MWLFTKYVKRKDNEKTFPPLKLPGNKRVFEMKTIRNISLIIVSEVANTNIAKQCLECLKQKKQKMDINWNMCLKL